MITREAIVMNKDRKQVLEKTIKRCREKNIIIPTFEQMYNPEKVPQGIKDELKNIGLWDLEPRNLFRITWKNEPVKHGGRFDGVNYIELPREITGVKARIMVLVGKFFPTGAHKVGACFGPLVTKLITGEFDPTTQKAVWPSTGNYCRGGAYDSYLLDVPAIAILPEGMSKERFDWLKTVGSEIFATPGVESNVKEIYDKCHELKAERGDGVVILNQFEDMTNMMWHYAVTGRAMEEVYEKNKKANQRFSALFLTQGSAGTLGSAEYIRKFHPSVKVGAGEALECPTLLYNGFGGHRIEGIGDKHVPWILNLKNMDMVAGIEDEKCMRMIRLFNEKKGHAYLKKQGVSDEIISKLDLLGISSVANIIGAIKMAKYYEMTENDMVFTVATDSMELYGSRIKELKEERGEYTDVDSAKDYETCLQEIDTEHLIELSYRDKKRMHNLKYFTWVEQQGKEVEDLDAQWYDENWWSDRLDITDKWDKLINEFNEKTGLIKKYQ
ncbi:MAG: pyridoxal-5-phosphate-dependent protein subunit beta [Elusimicrobia bacterium CG_4_10_14_3_um_filter_49_12_50_7]|nr:MAG: pyridoxal-5-phosphate-dependent protein subunit beta [Elusimicrobia bacterium CG_4_10_14_3_um_filter_49_12_50_7]